MLFGGTVPLNAVEKPVEVIDVQVIAACAPDAEVSSAAVISARPKIRFIV